ncbi:MAG TPA: phosphoribosyltransferase family protein [Candidatus Obscuribacterales bacterium]
MFKDRREAGKLLAIAIAEAVTNAPQTRPIRTVVVGIARGGVIVAKEVSSMLCAPLTLTVAKHINSPQEPDIPVGAVSSRGTLVLSHTFDESVEGLPSYVRNQQMQLSRLNKTLEKHWLDEAQYQPPSMANKRVVVVSDCCVTGLLEMATLRTLKEDHPNQMILGSPVMSQQARYLLESECQMVIALQIPASLNGAMQFYGSFPHVEDSEIVDAIKAANRHGSSAMRE